MADNYTPRVKAILSENGCTFVRRGKGDHEIWQSPISNRRFMVDSFIKSRHGRTTRSSKLVYRRRSNPIGRHR
jgi:hypothetical protein